MPRSRALFDNILLLPLFQGLSREDFLDIAGSIRLAFHRIESRQTLFEQDEVCRRLCFVLKGHIQVTTSSDDHTYAITEWYDRPVVIQPEALFGRHTRYTRTFAVEPGAEILEIDKAAVRDILFEYPTFCMNFLNYLRAQMERLNRHARRAISTELDERFAQFLFARCWHPAGPKRVTIKMQQLAAELHETRLTISQMLRGLAERGLLTTGRGHIDIPRLELLQP